MKNASLLGEPDLDGNPWDGNGHYAPNGVHYHLYVTFSLNALDEEPVFHTRRLTTDPVQVGAICLVETVEATKGDLTETC